MRVRLLGPLDVLVDGVARPVPGRRRRAVLAALALRPGELVPFGSLVDVVWGDAPPSTVENTVQSHVSQLRRVLGGVGTIVARAGGYVLELGDEATDVTVAERLIRLGDDAPDPDRAADLFGEAVELWRGPALADLTGSPWFDDQARRLDLLYLSARRALAVAWLALGHDTKAVAELTVLGLTVVLADGRVIKTGGRARKSAAGYDLTRLLVGSEGTLGIITELTVRLHPLPESVAAAVCSFDTIDAAVNTVIATMQQGIAVARIELLDETQVAAVNRYSSLSYREAPTLFFEFHGPNADRVADDARAVEAIASEQGGAGFEWVTRLDERTRLWKARHDSYYASLALRPGSQAFITDVCVPISRLADCILESKQDTDASFLLSTYVGHVGDGNFHVIFLLDPGRPEDVAEARRLGARMVTRALAMGGTCTGEHGVGVGKLPFMRAEHGEGVDVMKAIKRALDPLGLMNPGKVVDA